jgi:hypothetical protein
MYLIGIQIFVIPLGVELPGAANIGLELFLS